MSPKRAAHGGRAATRRASRGGGSAAWSDARGRWGTRSRAYERRDRQGAIWIDFVDPDPAAQGRRVRMLLPDAPTTVRGADGTVDEALAALAQQAHHAFRQQLDALGRIPSSTEVARSGAPYKPTKPAPRSEGLTLRQGFDAWLNLSTGRFPTKTRRWKAVEHAADQLCSHFAPHTAWSDLTPSAIREYRRELARMAVASRGRGLRRAEIILDAFYSVGGWLRHHDMLEAGVGLSPKHWRRDLREDWDQILGRVTLPHRPRHSAEEVRRLFAALDDERVDPRMRLLFELAAEQRLGQAVRIMRTFLELPPVDAMTPEGKHGTVVITSVGRKLAAPIALSAVQRQRLDAAMREGYLHEVEDAFRRGVIRDYALFPGLRLKKGVVPAKDAESRMPMRPERLRYLFRQLERVAGVAHRPGRGWYGVRRSATDLAQDVSTDDRVLNAITGHADSRTRAAIYQERHRRVDLEKAAVVREQLRGRQVKADKEAAVDALTAEIERLEAKRAHLLAEMARQEP